jgi:hypothetical protein
MGGLTFVNRLALRPEKFTSSEFPLKDRSICETISIVSDKFTGIAAFLSTPEIVRAAPTCGSKGVAKDVMIASDEIKYGGLRGHCAVGI